jgi:RimJ/RimL family protein N-acetyltransferase
MSNRVHVTETSDGYDISFQSERLEMRSVKQSDLEHIVQQHNDPLLMTYFEAGGVQSRDYVTQFVTTTGIESFRNKNFLGIFSIFNENQFIGHLDIIPGEHPGEIEIGYIINKSEHGKGFGTEIARSAIATYIPELKRRGVQVNGEPVHKITATAHKDNTVSWI